MSICVFPGSFDPVTVGHIDLIRRASAVFDEVRIVVMINIRKAGCIPVESRIALLRKACSGIAHTSVDSWDGLLSDYMRINRCGIILRGVRGAVEAENEISAARINRQLYPGAETFLIPASEGLTDVSSSAVREIAAFGGDISPYVPSDLTEEIRNLLSNHSK